MICGSRGASSARKQQQQKTPKERNKMKNAEFNQKLEEGHGLIKGEFVMSKPETVRYLDKKTGRPAEFTKLSHYLKTALGVVAVDADTRKLPDFNPEKYVSPYKPGQRLGVFISGWVNNQGATTVRGEVVTLE